MQRRFLMDIKKIGNAGTLESSDILITVAPGENGIEIELNSDVKKQFADQIKQVIKNTVEKFEVKNIYIKAQDQGALDYAIRARTETALKRATQTEGMGDKS
jgi:citrate lyase subunit gamma (acyl carrier protein)